MSDATKKLIAELRQEHKPGGMSPRFQFCLCCEVEWPCASEKAADALEASLPSGRCSNPECPLRRAHSGPCAPQEWTGGDAVVLAAKYLAQAASDWSDTETGDHSHSLECTNWEAYRRDAYDMRAALVAAQGAAPQAESEHQHEEWMIRETGTGGHYCASCGEAVAPPRAPVLPSSTIDEDEILTGLRESFIDGDLTENSLAGFWIVEIPLEDALPTLAKRFAEWLKEQGR